MINLDRETPVTLAEAPKLIPAINAVPGMEARKPLHVRTIYEWTRHGKRGVVLETAMMGGILVTTKEALHRFFARLTDTRESRMATAERNPHRRSVRQRAMQYQATRRRLADDHGI